MKIALSSLDIIETSFGDINMKEDYRENCLHIWVSRKPIISVEGNHIVIKPQED